MLTELYGKAGKVCRPAREGQLRCPLIVRPTSEDVVTGNLFGVLRVIDARWWLPQLLNAALGTARFRQKAYRRFSIQLWENQPPYPRELLPWDEGSTQVDAVIRWENPPTTVFIEAKYTAPLSRHTEQGKRQGRYPSDQLIRNLRVGLRDAGWFRTDLINLPPRDFVLLVLSPERGNPLVERYQDRGRVLAAIPHSNRLRALPTGPFLGELAYGQVIAELHKTTRYMTRGERLLAETACDYLAHKLRQLRGESCSRQLSLLKK